MDVATFFSSDFVLVYEKMKCLNLLVLTINFLTSISNAPLLCAKNDEFVD